MKCRFCGSAIPENAANCPACGARSSSKNIVSEVSASRQVETNLTAIPLDNNMKESISTLTTESGSTGDSCTDGTGVAKKDVDEKPSLIRALKDDTNIEGLTFAGTDVNKNYGGSVGKKIGKAVSIIVFVLFTFGGSVGKKIVGAAGVLVVETVAGVFGLIKTIIWILGVIGALLLIIYLVETI